MSEDHDVLERIASEARTPARQVRHVRACPAGQGVRQGDVYLFALPGEPHHGSRMETRQLVAGTSTGSRHAVDGDATLYVRAGSSLLDGPYVHARSRVTIVHPEHAHISIPPGWYEVRYQIDFEDFDDRHGKRETDAPDSVPGPSTPVRD